MHQKLAWIQTLNILSRTIEENADIFADFLPSIFNNSIYQPEFLSTLKLVNITPLSLVSILSNNACFVEFPVL